MAAEETTANNSRTNEFQFHSRYIEGKHLHVG